MIGTENNSHGEDSLNLNPLLFEVPPGCVSRCYVALFILLRMAWRRSQVDTEIGGRGKKVLFYSIFIHEANPA
jgi:hypothetical protein